MSEPYSRAEVEALGNRTPTRGIFCPACETYLPQFAELSVEDAAEIRTNIRSIQQMKTLREKTGCSTLWAKIWWLHPDGPHEVSPSKPCPYCEYPLHPRANQCLLCKMDWHDSEHPVRRGDSIAEQILQADAGSTIRIKGGAAYCSALHYVYLKRPNDNLKLVRAEPN